LIDFCNIKKKFEGCATAEMRYAKLIELGRALPPLNPEFLKEENIVSGCQSIVYLGSYTEDGLMYFQAQSEALLSAGLAYLLVMAYSGHPAEAVLRCPPTFIEELQLASSLTPGRSNGLASMYLRMKQDAIKFLTSSVR
jgi:cysteine desulfuration protein SufE